MGRERRQREHRLPRFPFHCYTNPETLKQERASTTTRIQGLLSSQGIRVTSLSLIPSDFVVGGKPV
jgi:hypothetical protein